MSVYGAAGVLVALFAVAVIVGPTAYRLLHGLDRYGTQSPEVSLDPGHYPPSYAEPLHRLVLANAVAWSMREARAERAVTARYFKSVIEKRPQEKQNG